MKDQECLVQLYLLKHLMTSHTGISSNDQHLNTLVNIACKYFNEENGNLALDALYSLLVKNDLCHHKVDLQVWFAFVNPDKIEKVCKLLTDAIINLLKNKDDMLDDLRKEIERLFDNGNGNEQYSGDIDILMKKLMDPDIQLELKEDQNTKCNFRLSPILWAFIKVVF